MSDVKPGLEGVVAGETAICSVRPEGELIYRGYDVHDLAEQASFEEVAYLVLFGRLPNRARAGRVRRGAQVPPLAAAGGGGKP